MLSSKFPSRILVLGRETGPLAQLLKINLVNTKIGAVDVLGNMEMRKYSDWKFSVIKQVPNGSLERKKKKSHVSLLFELAKVMLEEKKFDLLIPIAPFHKYPDILDQLRNLCEIPLTTQESLESSYSSHVFIERLVEEFPQLVSYYNRLNINEILDENRDGVIITKTQNMIITTETKADLLQYPATKGYFIPLKEIHCAGFISTGESINYLGFQTLKSPDGYKFINKDFERNSYYPHSRDSNYRKNISKLVSIINQLNLVGLLSIFFGVIGNKIVPLSCNVLPDENVDLWMNKTHNKLILSLVKSVESPDPFSKDPLFGFKVPIHCSELSSVPAIPPEFATQRNLPGIRAHHEYPICAILGTSNTHQEIEKKIFRNRERVRQTLGIFNP